MNFPGRHICECTSAARRLSFRHADSHPRRVCSYLEDARVFLATKKLHSSEPDTVSGILLLGHSRIPPRAASTASVIRSVPCPRAALKRDTAFALARRPVYGTLPSAVIPARHNHNGIRAALKRNCTRARHRSSHIVTERISLPGLTTLSDKLVTRRRAHETALERAGHTVSGALSSGIPDPSPGGAHGERNLPGGHYNEILRSCTHRNTTPYERDTTLVHARRLDSGVDDLRVGTARVNYRYTVPCGLKARYYTRAPIGIRPVRPETAVLHSCTLDVLSRASMTYSAT